MASVATDLRSIGDPRLFLIQRISQFRPEVPKIGYYVFMKHLNSDDNLADLFLFSFNSQIYPTILPGSDIISPGIDLGQYLISELGLRLLTENDYKLIVE